MAVSLSEKPESRTYRYADGINGQSELELILDAHGSADEDEIVSACLASSLFPESVTKNGQVLYRQSINPSPVFIIDEPDKCVWKVVVRYAPRQPTDRDTVTPQRVDGTQYNFEVGSQTLHITHAIATSGQYVADGDSVTDHDGAIGVTPDGVQGVDISVPTYQFSETWVFAESDVTEAYVGDLFRLCSRTNDAEFRGLAAGECLFLGASGVSKEKGTVEITFRFAGSPNQTGIVIGPIEGIAKKGWEYLWVEYTAGKDGSSGRSTQTAKQVNVEQVYEDGDFSALLIGA